MSNLEIENNEVKTMSDLKVENIKISTVSIDESNNDLNRNQDLVTIVINDADGIHTINTNDNTIINVEDNSNSVAKSSNNSFTNTNIEFSNNPPDKTNADIASINVADAATTKTEANVAGNATEKPNDVPAYLVLTKAEKRLIFFGMCMGMFLAALDQLVVSVALPVIVKDLGGLQYFTWVIAAYLLTSSATMPLYGKFSDIYGRRAAMMFSLVWFLAGSLFCGFSTSIWLLIAGRAVQGIGSGGLMSLTMILIGDIAKPAVRPKYMSSISGIFGLATVLGPLIGGGFTEYVTWRWIFFINAPLVVITMVVTWILLRKIKNAQKDLKIDYLGSILIVLATSGFVLVVTWGGVSYAWSSPVIISLIVVSVVLFAGFVVQESYFSEPLVRFELYKIRNYAVSTAVMFLFGMALFGGFTFVPFYFEDVMLNSAIISGLKIIPMVVGVMVCSMITGIVISKTGNYIVFPVLGLAIFSTGLGLLMLMGTKTNYGLDTLYLFIVGSGMGFSFPVYNTIVQNSVPPKHMASSIATLTFVRQIGACIGVAILGTIYQRFINKYEHEFGNNHIVEVESRALHKVFEAAMICGLFAVVVAFGIKNEKLFSRANNQSNNKDANKIEGTDKQNAEPTTEQPVEGLVHAI